MFQISKQDHIYNAQEHHEKRFGYDVTRGATNHKRPSYSDLHIHSHNGEFEAKYQPTYPTDMKIRYLTTGLRRKGERADSFAESK
jgi:hypothetical protein